MILFSFRKLIMFCSLIIQSQLLKYLAENPASAQVFVFLMLGVTITFYKNFIFYLKIPPQNFIYQMDFW